LSDNVKLALRIASFNLVNVLHG